MRKFVVLLGICLICWTSQAAAQGAAAERGRFKLYLDATMFGYSRSVTEYTFVFASGQTESGSYTANNVVFGPFSGGGIGAGYAVTPYLIPQLYFSLQMRDAPRKGYDDAYALSYQLAPQVELVRPRGKVAPFATAGLLFAGSRINVREEEVNYMGDTESRDFRFGPTLSAGLHAFLASRAALDVSLRFNGSFTMRVNGVEVDEPTRLRHFDLLLMMGTSFWL